VEREFSEALKRIDGEERKRKRKLRT